MFVQIYKYLCMYTYMYDISFLYPWALNPYFQLTADRKYLKVM
jgi:hypothetical protein